jgi:Bacterial surface proteins containing Ig-like domains
MKKILATLMIGILCFALMPKISNADSISINKTTASMHEGDNLTLTISGTKGTVSWTSSDTKIATVANGKVTAKNEGTAIITAKIGKKKGGKKLTCKINVASRVQVDTSTISFTSEDDTESVPVKLYNPKENESVDFDIEDSDIADAEWNDDNTILTISPVANGTTTITVYPEVSTDDDDIPDMSHAVTIKVTVTGCADKSDDGGSIDATDDDSIN